MDPPAGTLRNVVREAARFDRGAVAPLAGLLAAVPVAGVLGGGVATGHTVAGLTMAAGAMLVGIAWRMSGGRPPLALMATDAVGMAAATFLGSVTGRVLWLHLVMLCLWSLLGGLVAGAGNRAGVVGTQAILAAVVFGRFGEPPAAALGLAGYVLAGGAVQVAFQSIVRWPPPLRVQRAETAEAYRRLAELAAGPPSGSTLPAAAALDDAESTLASPTLFGDPALMTLRSLVNEGRRLRLALIAVHTLLRQRAGTEDEVSRRASEILQLAAEQLRRTADAIVGDERAAEGLAEQARALQKQLDRLRGEEPAATETGPDPHVPTPLLIQRLESLAGQLRAVAGLAPRAGVGGGLLSRRPRRQAGGLRRKVTAALEQLIADASLRSHAGRHALRLAIVVPLAELVARALPLERSYWFVVAAATILRPEFTMTFRRGIERAVGTSLGVALAGAITVTLHPGEYAAVAAVGLLGWAAYATFPASFAVGFGFITTLVVFLLEAITPDTLATAGARLLDTVLGGLLGLLVYALWPTWTEAPARQALADLVAAASDYLAAVLAAVVAGRRADEGQMARLARAARLARTNAEAAVAQSLLEPQARRIDAERSQGVLSAMRRLVQAVHVLRVEAQEEGEHHPMPALVRLASDLRRQLGEVDSALRAGHRRPVPLPDLRGEFVALQRSSDAEREDSLVLLELDEIVDAANGLASLVGLEAAASPSEHEEAAVGG